MKNRNTLICVAGLVLLLAACSRSSEPRQVGTMIGANTVLKPDGQGKPCQAGVGRTYNVNIPSPLGNGEIIGATVFEPATMVCSKKYPLVLWQNGFGAPRPQTLVPTDPVTLIYTMVSPFTALVAAGYGVISYDPRGIGTSTGLIRVQDPDAEGANVVRLADWAEANLDWLAYGPSADGSDPHNLILGSVGPSYGGGFQNMLLAIDPKKRLDAIVPSVTWNDLRVSLSHGGVIKEHWLHALYADVSPAQFDPFMQAQATLAFSDIRPTSDILDFLNYHSLKYFCSGEHVATNGGPGTSPRLGPVYPPKVNALFIQSSRDTLFNLNEALANYECLKANGGDVRMFTIQAGHNTLGTATQTGLTDGGPTDPGNLYQPDPTATGTLCGGVQLSAAVLAFLDEHLKGMTGQVNQALGTKPVCLSLDVADSVKVDAIQRGGTQFTIGANTAGNTVTVGTDDSQNTTVALTTISDASNVLAGIPKLDVMVIDPDHPNAIGGDTIIYVGIGQKHLIGATPWDLVDNQLTPLRGLGHHVVELSGTLERALVGDQLGLMIFGANENQYPTASLTVHPPHAAKVRVQGTVQLPLLGNVPPAVAP